MEMHGEAKRRGFAVWKRILTRENVITVGKGLGWIVLAFLFDRCTLFFGMRPFGIALLCGAESGLFFLFLGLLFSALPIYGGMFRPFAIVTAVLTVLLRVAVRMTLDLPWKENGDVQVRSFRSFSAAVFREHIALRMALSCVIAFLSGLYLLILGGYQIYDLLGMLGMILLSPCATFLSVKGLRREAFRLRTGTDIVSALGVLGITVLSLGASEWVIYRISCAVLLAMGATLWITHRKGIAAGILAGLFFGLLVDPLTAPLYAFGAIASGTLKRVSIFMGALSALAVGMSWGFYVYGLGALSVLFPGLLAASLLFCVLERLSLLPGEEFVARRVYSRECERVEGGVSSDEPVGEDAQLRTLTAVLAEEKLHDEERRIEELCGAFLSVSELLRALRENGRHPSVEELRRVCDRVCDEFCPGCASCSVCWGSEYARMAAVLAHMAEQLRETGEVGEEVLPDEVRRRCKMSGAIFLRINEEAASLIASTLEREKAGVLSADYSAAALLFRSASKQGASEYLVDASRSAAAERYLREHGLYPSRAAVSGGRRGTLFAWNVDGERAKGIFSSESVRTEMMRLLGFRLGAPILTPIHGGGGLFDLRVPSVPHYRVRSAYASRSAEREGRAEGLCGDSVALFESADGRSFALLSDGMGSGRNAAELSGICTVFLQKMLSAGGDTGVILKMLNDFLVAGTTGESSATVDLLELDLYTGEGIFWKSGAAPTFILREGNLLRLSSRTAPAGILPEADVQRTEFRLYRGDVVVMLSDGITDEGGEPDLTAEMFAEVTGMLASEDLAGAYSDGTDAALARLAARIADGGAEGDGKRDDRTVILVYVEEDCALDEEENMRVAG